MPIHNIQTKEYECSWCGYRWINRFNGKDQPIPSRCARCKRTKWDKGQSDIIGSKERGLRRKIKGLNNLYRWYGYKNDKDIFFPTDICEKFLALQPRPTQQELIKVLSPLGFDTRKHPGYIPDSDRPGFLKHDSTQYVTYASPDNLHKKSSKWNDDNEYYKLLRKEAQMRIDLMTEIIRSRGLVDYDPYPGINKMREEYLSKQRNKEKSYNQDPEYKKILDTAFNEMVNNRNSWKEELHKKKSEQTKKWWESRRQQ